MAAQQLGGRSALVTGAGSGIGAAIARALAGAGAHVTVADRNAGSANSVAEEIGGSPWIADLSDTATLDDLSPDHDIVVNNAGFQHVSPIQDFDPAVFRAMQALMVEAPFLIARAVLPHMYAQGWGRFINISSVHGLRASPFKSSYVTAKHALEGLSKVIALEGGEHGVTSVCISPGYVRTPLVEGQIADQAKAHGIPEDEVIGSVLLARSARKQLLEPDDVAQLAVWLCSDAGAMASGTSFTLAGGWTAS